jgi:hypothetical protein
MNLNQITPGTDYAFFPRRGKSEEFRWSKRSNDSWDERSYDWIYGAKYLVYRVRAIRTYSEREAGKSRDTGYVDCFWLTDDGEFRLDEYGKHLIKKVPVRHIATIWDDYEDELDHQTVLKEQREREQEERRQKREQEYRERREREEREWKEQQERARLEREERERKEREELERKLQEEMEYCNAIERHYNLPGGSVKRHSNGHDLILDHEMVDLDMTEGISLIRWDMNGEREASPKSI